MDRDPDAHRKGLILRQVRYDLRRKNLQAYQYIEEMIRAQHQALGMEDELALDPEYWEIRRKLRFWQRQMDLGFEDGAECGRPLDNREIAARTLELIGRLTKHQRSPE